MAEHHTQTSAGDGLQYFRLICIAHWHPYVQSGVIAPSAQAVVHLFTHAASPYALHYCNVVSPAPNCQHAMSSSWLYCDS